MKVAVVLAAVAMVAGACSGSRGAAPGVAASGSSTTAAAGGSTTTSPQAATFGDLASPCGPGNAKGATDQGVTDTHITIGFGDDAGFTGSPGLDHEIGDAMRAMIKWCNDQGGINGRTIDGKYYDAKITEANNVMTTACAEDFMLVGELFAFDSTAEQTRLGCKLPAIPAAAVAPEVAHGAQVYSGVPNPADQSSFGDIAKFVAAKFPDQIAKTASLVPELQTDKDIRDKELQVLKLNGYGLLSCNVTYNILGEADYKPLVQKLKDCGAQVVYINGSPYPAMENFLDAAAQLDFKPIYIAEANLYDAGFAKWNTAGNGDTVFIRQAFVPFEEADQSPATKKYIDVVKANNGDISQLGGQATSSFLLWATAAKACGGTLTRDCVLKGIAATHTWTAGGLHSPQDPAANTAGQCGMVLQLKGTAYVRLTPAKAATFTCDPSNVVKVSGPAIDALKLDAQRISHKVQ